MEIHRGIKPFSRAWHYRPLTKAVAGAILALWWVLPLAAADLESQVAEAQKKLGAITAELNELAGNGRFAESNARLLDLFPPATRTPVQAFFLGNVLYGLEPGLSYALHREAAAKMPDEPLTLLEWGMEQHRAGEYAGALAAYDEFSKARPDDAPVHGLAADCLIRLGKVKEAVARWQKSEAARHGTLERFETLVCEVYKDSSLPRRRADLRVKALKGDFEASMALIALDGNFERDWWNKGPNPRFLEQDLAWLEKFPPNPRVKAAQCAVKCLLLEEPTKEQLRDVLTRHGYLFDPARTLLADPQLLALVFDLVVETGLLSPAEARSRFGEKLIAVARTSKNADLFNVIAKINAGTPAMLKLEKEAWDTTGDRRFAIGYLIERLSQKSLKPNDPDLRNAMKRYPEDAWIMGVAMAVNDLATHDLLVRGIKAEYRHFSGTGSLMNRPSARSLRSYFNKLAQMAR